MATNQFPPQSQLGPNGMVLQQTISSSGAVTIPSNVGIVYAVVIGGGGGGSAGTTTSSGGGGGGGGGYMSGFVPEITRD